MCWITNCLLGQTLPFSWKEVCIRSITWVSRTLHPATESTYQCGPTRSTICHRISISQPLSRNHWIYNHSFVKEPWESVWSNLASPVDYCTQSKIKYFNFLSKKMQWKTIATSKTPNSLFVWKFLTSEPSYTLFYLQKE